MATTWAEVMRQRGQLTPQEVKLVRQAAMREAHDDMSMDEYVHLVESGKYDEIDKMVRDRGSNPPDQFEGAMDAAKRKVITSAMIDAWHGGFMDAPTALRNIRKVADIGKTDGHPDDEMHALSVDLLDPSIHYEAPQPKPEPMEVDLRAFERAHGLTPTSNPQTVTGRELLHERDPAPEPDKPAGERQGGGIVG
jgi:hypothetical protein